MRRIILFISGGLALALFSLPGALAPWFARQTGEDIRAYEKREPHAWPRPVAARAWLETEFFTQVGSALNDRLPGRMALGALKRNLERKWLRVPGLNSVDFGRDGWLFIRDAYCRPGDYPERVAGVLALTEYALLRPRPNARCRDFRIVAVPDKDQVYSEYASPLMRLYRNQFAWRRQAMTELGARVPEGKYLYMLPALAAAKAKAPTPLYGVNDTHCTWAGAMVVIENLIRFLRPGLWDPGDVRQEGPAERIGDLTLKAGLGVGTEQYPYYHIVRPGVEKVSAGFLPGEADYWNLPQHYLSRSRGRPLLPGKTLILHDSNLKAYRDDLRQYFQDVTFRHYDRLASSQVFEQRFQEYDLIVLEVAERIALDSWEKLFRDSATQPIRDLLGAVLQEHSSAQFARSAVGLEVVNRNGRPILILPNLDLPDQGPYLLQVEVKSPAETEARLHWMDSRHPHYSENRFRLATLTEGWNKACFYLGAEQLRHAVRLDLGYAAGAYLIRSLELHRLPSVAAGQDQPGPEATGRQEVRLKLVWRSEATGRLRRTTEGPAVAVQQARLSLTPDGLQVDASGDDPILHLPPLTGVMGKTACLDLWLDAPRPTLFQCFWLEQPGQDYAEDRLLSANLQTGLNHLRLRLKPASLSLPVRLDLGAHPGQYLIRGLELSGLAAPGQGGVRVALVYPSQWIRGLPPEAKSGDSAFFLPGLLERVLGPGLLFPEAPHVSLSRAIDAESGSAGFSGASSRTASAAAGNRLWLRAHTVWFWYAWRLAAANAF